MNFNWKEICPVHLKPATSSMAKGHISCKMFLLYSEIYFSKYSSQYKTPFLYHLKMRIGLWVSNVWSDEMSQVAYSAFQNQKEMLSLLNRTRLSWHSVKLVIWIGEKCQTASELSFWRQCLILTYYKSSIGSEPAFLAASNGSSSNQVTSLVRPFFCSSLCNDFLKHDSLLC